MDEYIKRTDAYNAILDELVGTGYQSGALRAIEFIPTASVVPRAELAREIFEEIDKRFEALLGLYPCNGEFEDAKSFVEFHWKYIKKSIMHDYDTELKNKYTEADNETRN